MPSNHGSRTNPLDDRPRLVALKNFKALAGSRGLNRCINGGTRRRVLVFRLAPGKLLKKPGAYKLFFPAAFALAQRAFAAAASFARAAGLILNWRFAVLEAGTFPALFSRLIFPQRALAATRSFSRVAADIPDDLFFEVPEPSRPERSRSSFAICSLS